MSVLRAPTPPTSQVLTERLEWAIIGGGIHGTHLAVQLINTAGVSAQKIRIIDPNPVLLRSWQRCSGNTGMGYLRSPAVHHLDSDPWSLLRYARDNHNISEIDELFAPPFNRPSVALFAAHCADVVSRNALNELHVQDTATAISLSCDAASVRLSSGSTIHTDRVLLAMGAAGQPQWPAWARQLRDNGAQVQHVFQPGYALNPETWPDRVAVIGGGISGAQAALRLADGEREVHILARHTPREHQFDSDPGWAGPKNMRRFTATSCTIERRKLIHSARHTGSLPPSVHQDIQSALRQGALRWHRSEAPANLRGDTITFRLQEDLLEVDAVLLATGFAQHRPGGQLVDRLVEEYNLPCSTCGYPQVDTHLRWHPRVFVTGPLAELEIGPVSRNILGARRAAERIVQVTD